MASIRYIVTDIDSSVVFYRDQLEFRVDMHNPGKFAALIRDDFLAYSPRRLATPGEADGCPPDIRYLRFTPTRSSPAALT